MAMIHDRNPCFRRRPKNKQTAPGLVVTTRGFKLEFQPSPAPPRRPLAWVCDQQQEEASSLWSPTVPESHRPLGTYFQGCGRPVSEFEFEAVSLFGFRAHRHGRAGPQGASCRYRWWTLEMLLSLLLPLPCTAHALTKVVDARCRRGCRAEHHPTHQAVLAESQVAGGPSSTKLPLSSRLRKSVLFLGHRRFDGPDKSKA